jgi:hypothetical protein
MKAAALESTIAINQLTTGTTFKCYNDSTFS